MSDTTRDYTESEQYKDRVSFTQRQKNKKDAPPFLMKIGSDEIKLEQVILQNINAIQMTGWSSLDVWDSGKANSMYSALIVRLDTLVSGFLKSVENSNTREFFAKREEIIAKWKEAMDKEQAPFEYATQLYELIVTTLTNEGLFTIRKRSYFGVGWKNNMEEALLENIESTQVHETEDRDNG